MASLLLLVLAGSAFAAVEVRGADGFVVVHELVLDGPPQRAYQALTEQLSAWWNVDHSYSGEAANLSLDARAGGCFCEALPDGGSVEHMRVVFARPGKLLRLYGGLGPLQGMNAAGTMDFALAEADGGRTALQFRYTVGGYVPGGLDAIAEAVDGVLAGQLKRLQDYLADSR